MTQDPVLSLKELSYVYKEESELKIRLGTYRVVRLREIDAFRMFGLDTPGVCRVFV